MSEAPPPPPSRPEEPSGTTPPPPAGGYEQAPPPPAYETPGGYDAAGYGGAPAGAAYAEWPQRVLSALIDWFAPFIVAGILFQINNALGYLAWLAALGWAIYQAYLGGQTGQSLGKKTIGLRLISEQTGQVIGGGLGIGRYFLHIIDGLPCYLGYLWPLWDAKKQTFADKIVKTIVVKV